MTSDFIPEEINSPCCLFHRAYVEHDDRLTLLRVVNVAKALYGWRCRIYQFPPKWQLYIATEDLTKEELELLKQQQGPVIILVQLLWEVM